MIESPKPIRIAVAHDWLCGPRGGEAVLERIAALVQRDFTPAGLFVMFDDRRALSTTVDAWRKRGSVSSTRVGRNVLGLRLRRWLLPLYPRLVGTLEQSLAALHAESPIHLLISTSSAAVKGMKAPEGVRHLCYCHAPARYLWSQQAEYGGKGTAARLRKLGLQVCGSRLREWDKRTATHVDQFIANSRHTAGLVGRCYGREATVVHPPVRTTYFTPDSAVKRERFWLVVSALEPYKRVDLAIGAATRAGAELRIAGVGSMRAALEECAGARIKFLGRVSDEQLRKLYRTAALLVFPQVEDFGIVAVEAQACGLPVIARRAGGALDIVVEGATGVFFDEASAGPIVDAARRVPTDCAAACTKNAQRFSEAGFDTAMLRHLRAVPSSTGGTP